MSVHKERILYEDEFLLAVHKLSGELVVQGKGKVQKKPLLDFLREDYPQLRALHRLDYETSGVVLFAKTKEVHDEIVDNNFKDWRKVYTTIVAGRLDRKEGTITKKLPSRGRGLIDAVSHYKVIDLFVNSSFLDVEIETGRHHQIRRHLAGIRHPLVLDQEYGYKKYNSVFRHEFGVNKFFLHQKLVELPHPKTKELLSISAPLPKQFAAVIKKLCSI